MISEQIGASAGHVLNFGSQQGPIVATGLPLHNGNSAGQRFKSELQQWELEQILEKSRQVCTAGSQQAGIEGAAEPVFPPQIVTPAGQVCLEESQQSVLGGIGVTADVVSAPPEPQIGTFDGH